MLHNELSLSVSSSWFTCGEKSSEQKITSEVVLFINFFEKKQVGCPL